MQCQKCSAEIKDPAAYSCPVCGKTLSNETEQDKENFLEDIFETFVTVVLVFLGLLLFIPFLILLGFVIHIHMYGFTK